MKKTLSLFFVILFSTVFSTAGFCQRAFESTTLINGYWGDWQLQTYYNLRGSLDDFIIVDKYSHPSDYILRIKIDNFSIETDKNEIKRRIKSKDYYKYTGTVEYYANSTYPDFKSQLHNWPYAGAPGATFSGVIQRIRNAKINIQPYRKNPSVYNIYFDNIGIAINLK